MAQSVSEASVQAESQASKSRHPSLRLLIPLVILLVGGGLATWYLLSRPKADGLKLSGRLEGYETDVGTKVAGRVQEVTVREGTEVKRGELLVKMDDEEIQAQLRGAIAALEAARQKEATARLQISVSENQIAEAQLNLQQSQGDTEGRVSQAEATVATAIAQLRQAEAQVVQARSQLRLAQLDRDRFAQMVGEGAVTQQQYDQAETTLETTQAILRSQEATVEAGRRQVAAAQGGLTQTRSTNLNPQIRNVQVNRLNTQLEQARLQLAIAQSEVANAQAARQQIQSQIDDLNISSPINGVVTVRIVEPGAVVTTGKTLLTLLDLNTIYLRGFIPAGEIGNVRVGQAARVYLDSAPDRPLAAKVAAIDAQASFTPENIYFREDRVQQVFGVRITIDNPEGFAKPGMPADAEIVTQERG